MIEELPLGEPYTLFTHYHELFVFYHPFLVEPCIRPSFSPQSLKQYVVLDPTMDT